MTNSKNYHRFRRFFVILITIFSLISCNKHSYNLYKIEAKKIAVTKENSQNSDIENYIKPYRDHINKDLDKILTYNPTTLDKSVGKWQTSIGNLMAEGAIIQGNFVFEKTQNKKIDLCILNNGGIRAILPQGNVTLRTCFEIMPFENKLVVLEVNANIIQNMVDYFIAGKKPHPLAGIQFTIDKNGKSKNILIQGKPLDLQQKYYIATNDYLANGGDNMTFFKDASQTFDLNYKLRNVFIDYFSSLKEIKEIKEIRVIEE